MYGPKEGVLINGLFLDGALWDPSIDALVDCRSGHRFSRLPEIHFIPTEVTGEVLHRLIYDCVSEKTGHWFSKYCRHLTIEPLY